MTQEESRTILIAFGRAILFRGIKIGFLGGLTVGLIAGGLVMLWLQ